MALLELEEETSDLRTEGIYERKIINSRQNRPKDKSRPTL